MGRPSRTLPVRRQRTAVRGRRTSGQIPDQSIDGAASHRCCGVSPWRSTARSGGWCSEVASLRSPTGQIRGRAPRPAAWTLVRSLLHRYFDEVAHRGNPSTTGEEFRTHLPEAPLADSATSDARQTEAAVGTVPECVPRRQQLCRGRDCRGRRIAMGTRCQAVGRPELHDLPRTIDKSRQRVDPIAPKLAARRPSLDDDPRREAETVGVRLAPHRSRA